MTLADNVRRLTSPHGQPTPAPPLLEQLDRAITEQTQRNGSGSDGKPIPIGTGALSLRQDIEREAREYQQEITGSGFGALAGILQTWANLSGAWADYLEHVTLDWCDRITAITNPTKPPRRLNQPCPSCGVLYGGDDMKPGLQLHCWDDDGTMLKVWQWTADCIHCGAGWGNEEMGWFRRAVNVAS